MAQNPFLTTVPWEQNPMFLAAINRNTLPNGPHTYGKASMTQCLAANQTN